MSINITPAPLFTISSSFHYTEDNDRISQLNINDQLLADQINQILGGSNGSMTATGAWGSISILADTDSVVDGAPFCIETKVWGIENLSSISSQNSFLFSYLIFGYRDTSGNLQLSGTAPVYIKNIGVKNVTPVIDVVNNRISISITGFTGSNGKISGRVTNFG